MSNDLGTDSTSWHDHKPSWHCPPPLKTENIGSNLGYLQGSGKHVNYLPSLAVALKQWYSKNKSQLYGTNSKLLMSAPI